MDNKARTQGRNIWNPPRVASCACGWTKRFPNLRAANDGTKRHAREGCDALRGVPPSLAAFQYEEAPA